MVNRENETSKAFAHNQYNKECVAAKKVLFHFTCTSNPKWKTETCSRHLGAK